MTSHRDLLYVSAAAVVCALVAAVPVEGVAMVAAVPLTLVLPGYAITAAAFGDRMPPAAHTFALTIAMSLGVLVLGALTLNYVPGGIRESTWSLLLVAVVVGACAVAARRRTGPAPEIRLRLPRWRPRRAEALMLIGSVVAVAIAFGLAWTPLPASKAVGFTQLSMLPTGDGKDPEVQIEVVSQEKEPVSYSLGVESVTGSATVFSSLELRPGDARVVNVPLPRSNSRSPMRISALLYRDDDPEQVYRRVTALIPPDNQSP